MMYCTTVYIPDFLCEVGVNTRKSNQCHVIQVYGDRGDTRGIILKAIMESLSIRKGIRHGIFG